MNEITIKTAFELAEKMMENELASAILIIDDTTTIDYSEIIIN